LRYLSLTDADREAMLAEIGVDSVDELSLLDAMKLGLAQADDVSKRVKATLIFLSQTDGH